MKQIIKKTLYLGAICMTMTYCAKGEDKATTTKETYKPTACGSSCASSPQALAANDTVATGIYKGVITGSTGNFEIDYNNDGTGGLPKFKYTFIPDDAAPCSQTITGTAAVGTGHTLTFNGSCYVSFTLVVVLANTGSVTSATLTIGGVTKNVTMYKELSTALIRSFEGTATGTTASELGSQAVSGVWNLTTIGETAAQGYSSYGGSLPATNLNVTTKVLTVTSGVSACPSTLSACNCYLTALSSQGLTLPTSSISGTWSLKLNATCATLGAAPAGWTIASGTWSGIRTK